MQCNIDQRGRRVRMAWGVWMLVLAAVAAALGVAQIVGLWWAGGLAIVFMALGAFGIYEARKGWCAVRAMGIKTPV